MLFSSKILPAGLILACSIDPTAHASDMSMASRCLGYGQQAMKDNPETVAMLRQATITGGTLQVNRYTQWLGKQFISTELSAEIQSNSIKRGNILCLFGSDTAPLYFHLTLLTGDR